MRSTQGEERPFLLRYNHFCLETNKEEYRTLTVNMYKKINLMQVIVWPIICFSFYYFYYMYIITKSSFKNNIFLKNNLTSFQIFPNLFDHFLVFFEQLS